MALTTTLTRIVDTITVTEHNARLENVSLHSLVERQKRNGYNVERILPSYQLSGKAVIMYRFLTNKSTAGIRTNH